MIEHREKAWWYLLNGVSRKAIVHGVLPNSRHVIVNEFPKSGGTWLSQMISDSLKLPFPQNRLPMLNPCVMHGHYLGGWDAKNMVVLWRDGRDVTISMYYHYLFQNEKGSPRIKSMIGKHLNFNDNVDIHSNLPRFIEFIFKDKVTPKFSWSNHVDNWSRKQVCSTRYEDLRIRPESELKRILCELGHSAVDDEVIHHIVDKYSFEKQSGRKPGTENVSSFIRKGIVGDWRNHFNEESRVLFCKYAGDQLVSLGYEVDDSWVSSD